MRELDIYDSQGKAIDGTSSDPRVKDFFFDGVRLALDVSGGSIEIICFFRARDDSASRSEQYYAVFKSSRRSDHKQFPGLLEERVEKELGLILDTSSDDTAVFEMLRDGTNVSPGINNRDVADAKQLLKSGSTVKLGVGHYRDAIGVIYEFWGEGNANRLAIAENADSSHLSSYDIVVEKGTHSGVEFISDTDEAIQDIRRRRRQSTDPSYNESDQSSNTRLVDVLVGSILLVGILLVIIGLFGVCAIGSNIPGANVIPGIDCGGSGTQYQVEVTDVSWNGDGTATLAGTLKNGSGGAVDGPVSLNATLSINEEASSENEANADRTWSEISEKQLTDVSTNNGTYISNINWENVSSEPDQEYRVAVEFQGATGNWTSPTPVNEETSTPAPTPTDTETSSPTELMTPPNETSSTPNRTSTTTSTNTPTNTTSTPTNTTGNESAQVVRPASPSTVKNLFTSG